MRYARGLAPKLLVFLIGVYWLLPDDVYRLAALSEPLLNPLNQHRTHYNQLALQPNVLDVCLSALSIAVIVQGPAYFRRALVVLGLVWVATWSFTLWHTSVILCDAPLWFLMVVPPALALPAALSSDGLRDLIEFEALTLSMVAVGAYALGRFRVGARLNVPGLGPNTSMVVFASLCVLAAVPSRGVLRWWGFRAADLFLGGVGILLSGSRITLIVTVAVVLLWFANRFLLRRKGAALGTLVVLALCIGIGMRLLSTGTLGGSVIQARWREMLDASSKSAIGRYNSLRVGWQLMHQYPLGIGNSDWLMQAMVQQLGYPTFVHSALIEWYLRLGPLFILALACLMHNLTRLYLCWMPDWYTYLSMAYVLRETLSYGFYSPKFSVMVLSVVFLTLFEARRRSRLRARGRREVRSVGPCTRGACRLDGSSRELV